MITRWGLAIVGALLAGLAFPLGAGADPAGLNSPTSGSISGTVVDAAGQPVEQVCVQASTSSHAGGEACTGTDGEYTITGLLPGKYKVQFIPYAADVYLVGQVWPQHQGLSAKGTSIVVRAGRDHRGIDASLSDGGRVLVLVYTSAGQPISDETVCTVLATHKVVDGNCGGTDLTGRGTTGAAPAGPEKVEALGVDGAVFAPGTSSYRLATTIDFVVDQTVEVVITLPKGS